MSASASGLRLVSSTDVLDLHRSKPGLPLEVTYFADCTLQSVVLRKCSPAAQHTERPLHQDRADPQLIQADCMNASVSHL